MGKIVWIASYPKSGNTWLRIFLFNLFANARTPLPLSEVSRMSTGDTVLSWYRALDGREPARWSLEDVARLRHEVQRAIAAKRPDNVFAKTHAALVPMAGVPPFAADATAGAIYIVRNPLDIAPSYARHAGIAIDEAIEVMARPGHMLPRTEALAEFVQGGWSQHVASWTARENPSVHVLRYEDMAARPEAAFGGVCAFLGLATTPERLARAIDHASIGVLRRLEDEQGFNERMRSQTRFFGEGGVGAWQRELDGAQARRILERHRVQMERFGYLE